jgi:hypothetical protein
LRPTKKPDTFYSVAEQLELISCHNVKSRVVKNAIRVCGKELLETEKTPKRQRRQNANHFPYGVLAEMRPKVASSLAVWRFLTSQIFIMHT